MINSYYGINCMDDSALANESHGFVLTMAHIFRLTFLSDKPDHKPHPMTYQKMVGKKPSANGHVQYPIRIMPSLYIVVYIYIYMCVLSHFIP